MGHWTPTDVEPKDYDDDDDELRHINTNYIMLNTTGKMDGRTVGRILFWPI